jgi:hypothetical protein
MWIALALVIPTGMATYQAPTAYAETCSFPTPSPLPSADGQIASAADLFWLYDQNTDWTANWEQTADINMGGCSISNGIGPTDNFPPFDNGFAGTYDGGGHRIEGLNIEGSDSKVGLFRQVIGGTVTNLHFRGTVSNGGLETGGLAGQVRSGTVSNSSFVGSVDNTFPGSKYGGLIGQTVDATVENSSASVNVSTIYPNSSLFGGLIGSALGSVISDTFARGNVTGGNRVGGLIGETSNTTAIGSSYATTAVSALETSPVEGGLIGEDSDSTTTVNDSFWDNQTSGQATSDGGLGKTTSEMKAVGTFATWSIAEGYDASYTWGICSAVNDGYPNRYPT